MAIDFRYRDAIASDVDALVDMWWQMQSSHHAYEPDWFEDIGEEACKASWRTHYAELLADERAVVTVATQGACIAGFMVAQICSRPPIFTIQSSIAILSAVVGEDYRRRGVFRGMMAFLEEKARAEGVGVIRLSVHCKNESAIQAYEKSGFVPEMTSMLKWVR